MLEEKIETYLSKHGTKTPDVLFDIYIELVNVPVTFVYLMIENKVIKCQITIAGKMTRMSILPTSKLGNNGKMTSHQT